MTIPCKADDGWKCPYIRTCLARLNDPSIIGCGYPLYLHGILQSKSDVYVVHRVKTDAENIPQRKTAYRKCKECKWLSDEKCTIGRKCVNPQRKWRSNTAMWHSPSCKACKMFEEGEANEVN